MKFASLFILGLVALSLGACGQPETGAATAAADPGATPAAATTPAATSTPAKLADTKTTTPASANKTYQYDAAKGKQLYADTCSVCHQATGLGIPGAFPPLKGNPVVLDPDPTRHIRTVLHGAKGPITVNGARFNGVMPAFGNNLTDAEAANLINWERSSWGNHAKRVTPTEVAAVRAGGKAE